MDGCDVDGVMKRLVVRLKLESGWLAVDKSDKRG